MTPEHTTQPEHAAAPQPRPSRRQRMEQLGVWAVAFAVLLSLGQLGQVGSAGSLQANSATGTTASATAALANVDAMGNSTGSTVDAETYANFESELTKSVDKYIEALQPIPGCGFLFSDEVIQNVAYSRAYGTGANGFNKTSNNQLVTENYRRILSAAQDIARINREMDDARQQRYSAWQTDRQLRKLEALEIATSQTNRLLGVVADVQRLAVQNTASTADNTNAIIGILQQGLPTINANLQTVITNTKDTAKNTYDIAQNTKDIAGNTKDIAGNTNKEIKGAGSNGVGSGSGSGSGQGITTFTGFAPTAKGMQGTGQFVAPNGGLGGSDTGAAGENIAASYVLEDSARTLVSGTRTAVGDAGAQAVAGPADVYSAGSAPTHLLLTADKGGMAEYLGVWQLQSCPAAYRQAIEAEVRMAMKPTTPVADEQEAIKKFFEGFNADWIKRINPNTAEAAAAAGVS